MKRETLFGSLIMVVGMSNVTVVDASAVDMLIEIIIDVVDLIICVLNYPIYAYIKNKKLLKSRIKRVLCL